MEGETNVLLTCGAKLYTLYGCQTAYLRKVDANTDAVRLSCIFERYDQYLSTVYRS